MSNIINFPGDFVGIKEKQEVQNDGENTFKLYDTIDTLDFGESDEEDMREAIISTPQIDILVIHDMEEDDYYIRAGNLLTHCETKDEANNILRDILRSLKKL